MKEDEYIDDVVKDGGDGKGGRGGGYDIKMKNRGGCGSNSAKVQQLLSIRVFAILTFLPLPSLLLHLNVLVSITQANIQHATAII